MTYVRTIKTCSICHKEKNTRWYRKDVCLSCYTRLKRNDPSLLPPINLQRDSAQTLCVICNTNFLAVNSNAKTCSATCRSRAHSLRHRNTTIKKLCSLCSAPFITKGTAHNKQYCSDSCRNKNRYEREHSIENNRLKKSIRSRVHDALKGNLKPSSFSEALGCTIEQLRKYLESKFQPGMTWNNRSREGWHIDHIIPLSNFDLSDPEQFKKACHYTNLQPLWAADNLAKGAKLEDPTNRRSPPKTI